MSCLVFVSAENKKIKAFEQLESTYKQLAAAQQEEKQKYDTLNERNQKLLKANSRLSRSAGEFYTLQKISQAISSILDVKELLKYVNDVILGVMGVNYSTVILYDKKTESLRVYTTNIESKEELELLSSNIHCNALLHSLNDNKPVIDNNVECNEYSFTKDRQVGSFICMPIITKSSRQGLILIEHMQKNAFDEESIRLLDVIGQQVGIGLENVSLYEKMQEMATIDGLTGVHNRMSFQERLVKELEKASNQGYKLSLAIMDIDHFKKFNDTFGHVFGDKVIKSIADLMSTSISSSDIIARYGGEEFVIIYPGVGLDEAYRDVEALRKKISEATITDENIYASVTASFGVACYPESTHITNRLLNIADKALYEAKASGRNCVIVAA